MQSYSTYPPTAAAASPPAPSIDDTYLPTRGVQRSFQQPPCPETGGLRDSRASSREVEEPLQRVANLEAAAARRANERRPEERIRTSQSAACDSARFNF
jgi:hypothetical protein